MDQSHTAVAAVNNSNSLTHPVVAHHHHHQQSQYIPLMHQTSMTYSASQPFITQYNQTSTQQHEQQLASRPASAIPTQTRPYQPTTTTTTLIQQPQYAQQYHHQQQQHSMTTASNYYPQTQPSCFATNIGSHPYYIMSSSTSSAYQNSGSIFSKITLLKR